MEEQFRQSHGEASWKSPRGVGRISALPPNATKSERGCVVLDQPQQVEIPGSIKCILTVTRCEAAAAGLRHSRAPGQCADAPASPSPVLPPLQKSRWTRPTPFRAARVDHVAAGISLCRGGRASRRPEKFSIDPSVTDGTTIKTYRHSLVQEEPLPFVKSAAVPGACARMTCPLIRAASSPASSRTRRAIASGDEIPSGGTTRPAQRLDSGPARCLRHHRRWIEVR